METNQRQHSSRAPTRVDQLVGEKIRKLRISQNMTLAELGTELGISHQQLQKYETGTNRLSAGMLSNVAHVLRVPISGLFQEANNELDDADPMEHLRNECREWLDRADSEETLTTISRVLKAIIAN